ncbi:hypothetical protein ACFX13_041968 [Malus domestica]
MAESSKEELLQLIKRFGAYLTVKMSSLFPISLHNLNSRSIGAIAGFAVAIVFTWRLLRPPSGPQRRQPKRQAPASSSFGISSNSNATLTTPGVSSSEDSRTQNSSLTDPEGRLGQWDLANRSVASICKLVGVSCWNEKENCLISLQLPSMELVGMLPESLKFCHSLQSLDLSGNALSGSIPPQNLQLASLPRNTGSLRQRSLRFHPAGDRQLAGQKKRSFGDGVGDGERSEGG